MEYHGGLCRTILFWSRRVFWDWGIYLYCDVYRFWDIALDWYGNRYVFCRNLWCVYGLADLSFWCEVYFVSDGNFCFCWNVSFDSSRLGFHLCLYRCEFADYRRRFMEANAF